MGGAAVEGMGGEGTIGVGTRGVGAKGRNERCRSGGEEWKIRGKNDKLL